MLYSLAADDLPGRQKQDAHIEADRAPVKIFDVEFHFLRNRQFVAAVDLSPPRQSRQEFVDAVGRPQFDQIILIVERWPRPDETHPAPQNAPELRQFVEAGLAQKRTDGGQKPIGIFEQMCGNRRRVDAHAAKFRHQEDLIEAADTFGPVEDRARRSHANAESDDKDRNKQDDRRDHSQKNIDRPFQTHAPHLFHRLKGDFAIRPTAPYRQKNAARQFRLLPLSSMTGLLIIACVP
ncbi:hypothetical protein RHECNPAF_2330045 [Rhizobium etli CNPAF512]|nr:hypothetical protein RHECNPAF_2330045 [Rhizobium etli CNPAF512]